MKIGSIQGTTPGAIERTRQKEQRQEELKKHREDSIEISDDARQRLAELADQFLRAEQAQSGEPEDRHERLARIQRQIDAGYYDLPAITDKIIDKLADTMINEIDQARNEEQP